MLWFGAVETAWRLILKLRVGIKTSLKNKKKLEDVGQTRNGIRGLSKTVINLCS
jgi:hypothetical protein